MTIDAAGVHAVLFDTFGTVVDWRSGISAAVSDVVDRHGLGIDPTALADAWRAQYQPAMETVRSGRRAYVSLDQLHVEGLRIALHAAGMPDEALPDDEVWALARRWRDLPPWPDSVEGLSALKERYVIGPLSNAHTALLVDMAKRCRLPWDVVIGSDVTRAYKPDPRAYLRAAALLELEPTQIVFAAAHNDDLAAAAPLGFRTAFIRRPNEHGPAQTVDLMPTGEWDFVTAGIDELAEALGVTRSAPPFRPAIEGIRAVPL